MSIAQINLDEIEVDPGCSVVFPLETALEHRMVAVQLTRDVAIIAVANETAARAILPTLGLRHGLKIQLVLAFDQAIERAIRRIYPSA